MKIALRTRSGINRSTLLRIVFGSGLLAVAVIFGLLAMHGLALHDASGGHESSSVTFAISGADVDAAAHGGTSDSPVGLTCADCTDDHVAMTKACFLFALFIVFLLILPTRLLLGRMRVPWNRMLVGGAAILVFPRAPSLHVLCICRT